jgi:hypothetical protein
VLKKRRISPDFPSTPTQFQFPIHFQSIATALTDTITTQQSNSKTIPALPSAMLGPGFAKLWVHFFPIGNTPAVSLTQGLPPEKKADILLLGCGDIRNILFTLHCDSPRQFDITCCDLESTVIGENSPVLIVFSDYLTFCSPQHPATHTHPR